MVNTQQFAAHTLVALLTITRLETHQVHSTSSQGQCNQQYILQIAQIQSRKCCALGGFLIELWPKAPVVCTAVRCPRCPPIGSVADHNSIRNPPSAQHFLARSTQQQYILQIVQIQSGKCCALGGFLIELWSIVVQPLPKVPVVYIAVCCTHISSVADHNSIRNPPSAQHFPL